MNPIEDLRTSLRLLTTRQPGIPAKVQIPRITAERFKTVTKEQWSEWSRGFLDSEQIDDIMALIRLHGAHGLSGLNFGPTTLYVAELEDDDCKEIQILV